MMSPSGYSLPAAYAQTDTTGFLDRLCYVVSLVGGLQECFKHLGDIFGPTTGRVLVGGEERIKNEFCFCVQKGNNYDYEHSELLLYQNLVIQESGDLKEALRHLEASQDQIVDKLTLKENLGELNLKLKQYEKSAKYYEELIQRNPENTMYYNKLIEAKNLTKPEDIVNFYLECSEKYPRAMPPRRLPLNYAIGDQFRNLVDKYMRRSLSKGVPPLFVDLRSLYTDKSKVETIESLLLQYVDALKKVGKYSEAEVNNGPKEPASALLWVYYYLAQHHDYLDQTEKAVSYIDAAIEHTPTLIELFVTKGRIYKVSKLNFPSHLVEIISKLRNLTVAC